MSFAIVCLGSNLGDRRDMLKQAVERISYSNKIISVSDIYETRHKHGTTQDPYLNCCVSLNTDMTSTQLLQFLLEIERQLSSKQSRERYQHFSIDCDLIAFDNEILRTPMLTLPHPEAHRRAFVMVPLSEIEPTWVHPVLNKPAAELAKEAFWDGWGSFFAPGKTLLDF